MAIRPIALLLMLLPACDARALDASSFMDALTWEKRVVVMFTPDAADPDFTHQEQAFASEEDGLTERHMMLIRAFADGRLSVDGESREDAGASFYRHFGSDPNRFRIVLVGKDGTVKLDRDAAVSVGELFALIDSMPMRRQEMLQDN